MPTTTIKGSLRTGSFGSSSVGTPAMILRGSFDPTSATQISLGTLPKGAIPTGVQSLGGATGGTNPTVDIGTSGDDDGLGNEVDADGVDLGFSSGALSGIELTANTEIFGKVGASAATGGTTTVLVWYVMAESVAP